MTIDGYDGVQLAFEVPERKLSQPERGHLEEGRRRAAPPPARVPRRVRDSPSGERRDRRALRAGRRHQGDRPLEGQGLRRHHQAPQLRPRPGVARLAQRARAGLDRPVGDALARHQGPAHGRAHGRRARHPARPEGAGRRRRAQPAAASPAPCRARPAASCSCGRIADGRAHRTRRRRERGPSSSRPTCSATRPTGSCCYEAVRAEMLARRRQGTSHDQDARPGGRRRAPSRGARRAPAAPARARPARRSGSGGGVAFGPQPRDYARQDEPQGDRGAPSSWRCRSTPRSRASACSTAERSRAAHARTRALLVAGLGPAAAARRARRRTTRSPAALSFRNLERVDRRLGRGHHRRRTCSGRAACSSRRSRWPSSQGGADVTSVTTDPRHVILERRSSRRRPTT